MTFQSRGRGTNSKTLRFARASSSRWHASCQGCCSSFGKRAKSLYPHVLGSVVALAVGGIAFARRNERLGTPPPRVPLLLVTSLFCSKSPQKFPSPSSSDSGGGGCSSGVGTLGSGAREGPGCLPLAPGIVPSICRHSFRVSLLSFRISVGLRVSP